jgi:thymidine phosphorylase
MLPQRIIAAKRDGRALAPSDIEVFVAGITDGRVGDEQLGAFAMAVFINGLNPDERLSLTRAMRDSGRVLQWPDLDGPVLDKHSTGGVGDAVSLILGPWVAACGGYVPMISGHGLGHTGGTLDKLAAIPGYDPFPEIEALSRIVRETGVAIVGQTDDLAPADRRFYAVRDVTATVECIPLIVASILSKKLAEGLDALVLDVKTGSGSVMGDLARCTELAEVLCDTASQAGTVATALITDMDQVLARSAGNALEVLECIEILTGERTEGRMLTITRELAVEMLLAGGLCETRDAAELRLDAALADGRAAERFATMVRAMGGPSDLLDRPTAHFPDAPVMIEAAPAGTGRVSRIDVRAVGTVVVELGGGRHRAGDRIDSRVGLSDVAAIGERVDAHRPLARVHARTREDAERAAESLRRAFAVNEAAACPEPIRKRIRPGNGRIGEASA